MIEKHYYFLGIGLFFLLFGSCGNDKDCHCIYDNTEMSSDEKCHCPEGFYQFGEYSSSCDELKKTGICFEKKENRYLMTHDCKCTTLTAYDSVGVGLNTFGLNWANKFTGGGRGGLTGDYYLEKPDGNEFYFTYISSDIDSAFPDIECEGEYPANAFGFMKGKFNPENTYCKTKIYWKVGSTIVDSCNVELRR